MNITIYGTSQEMTSEWRAARTLGYSSVAVLLAMPQIRKTLIYVHRWLGVTLCLLFLLWFSSGIAMMYWDYPMVTANDRLSHGEVLDRSRIHLSPAEAYARLGTDMPPPAEARMAMFDGRPVYKFGTRADQLIVYADDGRHRTEFPSDITRRIAAAWTGQPAVSATEEDNVPQDQWTVSEEFGELRPLRKYTWRDGEQVYVSTVTGEVVQHTTRKSRLGAYLGPIPHWLYFTPLRKRDKQWSELVIWASGLASVLALIGIVVGAWMYSPSKPYRYGGAPSALPYIGWKRWHSIFGLVFGVLACTWAFSGMLSMDPFPQWQGERSNQTPARFDAALRGRSIELAAFAAKPPDEALSEAGVGVKELELTSFAGEPVYLAFASPIQTRVVPVHGESAREFAEEKIVAAVKSAALPFQISEIRTITVYDAYYLDRRDRLPLPVIFLGLDDPEGSTYYIDPKTARIVQTYNSLSRRNRWLYHGLHSFDLPALYKHRPAWDIVVLTLMLGGLCICITSLVLAWNVLQRKLK